jgi:hypothetical protein
VRKNEMSLMSRPRPIRSIHRVEGWNAETSAEQMLPAFKPSFCLVDRLTDLFS